MKKISILLIVSITFLISMTSFVQNFNEVKIGNQIWMTENLNVDKFKNGVSILQAKTAEEWQKASEKKQPAWCYYKYDSTNGKKYGKLYNWFAVNDPRGLAPKGWKIPSDDDWTQLTNFLGGKDIAATKMKSKSEWKNNGNGDNESGFTGLPGGHCFYLGTFEGDNGYWWSSTEKDAYTSWARVMTYSNKGLLGRYDYGKQYGFSVRCIKNNHNIF